MKTASFFLSLFALAAPRAESCPVLAIVDTAVPATEVPAPEFQRRIDERFEAASKLVPGTREFAHEIDNIAMLVRGLGLALEPFPGMCRIQARLETEVAEVQRRAARFVARAEDLTSLQEEIVLARLERAVIQLHEDLVAGKCTREEARKAYETLNSQAYDFLESLPLVSVRFRVSQAILALSADAHAQMDPYEHVRAVFVALMEARIEMALRRIAVHGAESRLSGRDVQRLIDAYLTQSKLVESAIAIPYDCGP